MAQPQEPSWNTTGSEAGQLAMPSNETGPNLRNQTVVRAGSVDRGLVSAAIGFWVRALPVRIAVAASVTVKDGNAGGGGACSLGLGIRLRDSMLQIDTGRPKILEVFALLRLWSYAHDMKTQFVLWLVLIVAGLAYMTLISFSGR